MWWQFVMVIAVAAGLSYLRGTIIRRYAGEYLALKVPAPNAPPGAPQIVFNGARLHFSDAILHHILFKYHPHYSNLDEHNKAVFIMRLRAFIRHKHFSIYTHEPFREMIVLSAAAAIQISFGLKRYLFPWFRFICIHPSEYLAVNPLRILAGNVEGTSISLSWRHLFDDMQQDTDGVNVGLHEMAHALHRQHEHFYGIRGSTFRTRFKAIDNLDETIMQRETRAATKFFPAYALQNIHEFWACSVELFFEKPDTLYN